MVDLDALATRARRAAEWGRLRMASRIGVAVVPLVLVSSLVGPSTPAVAALGTVLLAACVGAGWWSEDGVRAARSGLALGAIPMGAALVTVAIDGRCDPDRAVTLCGFGCLLAGLIAGGGSAWYALRSAPPRRRATWCAIALVTSLTAALGCAGLGLGSALAVLAALAAGAAIAWIPARART